MRLIHAALALACIPHLALAQIPLAASEFAYRFDLRQADGASAKLGLDFDLAYDRVATRANPQGNHYGLSMAAKGFTTFEKADRDVNAQVGQAALQGRYYHSKLAPLPAEQQRRYLDLADRDEAGGGPGLTKEEEKEYKQLMTALQQNRFFATYDLHYRLETTQHFTHSQSALGAGGSAEVPLLAGLLDIVPSMTRTAARTPGFKVQPVRAYVGFDYVRPHGDQSPRADSITHSWRSRAEMAWSTLVLDQFVLRASWEAQYLFGAPEVLQSAHRDFNNFLQVWLKLPVTKEAGMMVKYLSGRLPPNYDSTSVGSLGLSLAFY